MGHNSLSRRSVLSGLATAPLASMPALSAEVPHDDVRKLIVRHSAASAQFTATADRLSEGHVVTHTLPERIAAERRERLSRVLLCTFVCRSLAEERLRAQHFLARLSPLDHGDFEDESHVIEALLTSIATAGAAA